MQTFTSFVLAHPWLTLLVCGVLVVRGMIAILHRAITNFLKKTRTDTDRLFHLLHSHKLSDPEEAAFRAAWHAHCCVESARESTLSPISVRRRLLLLIDARQAARSGIQSLEAANPGEDLR